MSRRTLLFLVAAVLVVIATSWLTRELQRERRDTAEEARHVADYFLSDFTATTMNAAGEPRYRLSAKRLVHYPDTDSAEVTEPRMVLFRKQGPNWHARAAYGEVGPRGQVVQLRGDVELVEAVAVGEPMRVTTDNLTLYPERRYAETDAPVTITGERSRVDGVGMQLYLADERLLLKSEVHGVHQPQHKGPANARE